MLCGRIVRIRRVMACYIAAACYAISRAHVTYQLTRRSSCWCGAPVLFERRVQLPFALFDEQRGAW
jgi:hypothetical protein